MRPLQITWDYGANGALLDDAAVLDFGFLPAPPTNGLRLSTVDLPHYVAGSLPRLREFADCVSAVTPGSDDNTTSSAGGGLDGADQGQWEPVSTTGSSGGGWSGQFEDLERLEGSRNELDRLRKRLAAFPTSAMEDEAMLLSMDAPLGDTERLIVRFRKQRKLAITSFIRKLEVRLGVAGSKPLNV